MKRFRKYYSNRYSALLYNLELFYTYPEQEVLHKIRVELKKINTMFHLIHYCSVKFKSRKEFIDLKNIFREAGKIREMQQTYKLMLKYKIKRSLQKKIQDDEYDLTMNFRMKAGQFKKNINDVFERTKNYTSKINSGNLSEFLMIRQLKLQDLISPEPDPDNLHNVRKVIKDIVYLSEIKYGKNNNIEPVFDEIQNLIGKWHDKQILMKVLDEDRTAKHIRILEKLRSACEIDICSLKNQISAIQNKEFIQAD